ncbi:MAG: hypothetical protein ACK5MT_22660, partial [Actinomycetales bacterium]
MAPTFSRSMHGKIFRLIVALVTVAMLATAASPVFAASQNEVLITRNFDGTPAYTAVDANNPLDNGTAAPALHTPGQDSGPTNNVVRTYDLFGVRVHWNVNEQAATDVTLTITLSTRAGGTANLSWAPDDTGMFSGCGPGSTISGLTLTCRLGARSRGSSGDVMPMARLDAGVNASLIDVSATLTDAEGSTPATDALDTPFTVSEAPQSNWIKQQPTVVGPVTPPTGPNGYLALFPLTLENRTAANPAKGLGELVVNQPLTFIDHAYNLPTGSNLASQAQLDAATTAGFPVHGPRCGAYAAANNGPFPVTAGSWVCGGGVGANGYPVASVQIGSYSATPPATNADGSANSAGYILTGQIAFWMPETEVLADIAAGTAFYNNAISADALTALVTETTALTPISVFGHGGAVRNEPVSDNKSAFAVTASGGGGGGGGAPTPGSFTGQHGLIGHSLIEYVSTLAAPHDLEHPNIVPRTTAWAAGPFDGNGIVSRSTPLDMSLYVSTFSPSKDVTTPYHGCMTWDPTQIRLAPMPEFTKVDQLAGNIMVNRRLDGATGYLEEFVVGQSNGSSYAGPNRGVALMEFPPEIRSQFTVHIEYGWEDTTSYRDSVQQNSVECNNTAGRHWIDSTDRAALDTRLDADGNYQLSMVRVRVEGDIPWAAVYPDTGRQGQSPGAPYDTSGFFLNVHGVVGSDLVINHDDKSLYLHTSRAIGDWDPTTGPAPTTDCMPIDGSRDINLNTPTTPTGWCSQPYTASLPPELALGTPNSSLDPNSFTQWPIDADTNRVTIKSVRPVVTKTNVDGLSDIATNGEFVDFDITMSAVGASTEALSNLRMLDTLPSYYRFEALLEGPTKPETQCTYPLVGEAGDISCQLSEPNPAVDTGSLPAGIPGGWSDHIRIRVKVVGARATNNAYSALYNTAHLDSDGVGAWTANAWASPVGSDPKTSQSYAASYMPYAVDESMILKSVDSATAPCSQVPGNPYPTADELATWQERCATTGLDTDATNFSTTTDASGNLRFELGMTNTGNTRLSGVRIVDVFPHALDSLGEPDSNTPIQGGSTPTSGLGRLPGTSTTGDVGLRDLTGAATYWVSGDAAETISRDPDKTLATNTWCDAVGGTVQNGIGTDADCPQDPYQVTAVYATLAPIDPGITSKLTLTLDTENASCADIWTNNFGARTANVELPMRSNDVTIMSQCVFDLALQKRVVSVPSPLVVGSVVEFEIEVVNQGDPVQDVDVS